IVHTRPSNPIEKGKLSFQAIMGAVENFQRKSFILLIYFISSRSRLGNLAQASHSYVGLSRITSAPIGSQIVTSEFSLHTWCTRKLECTLTTNFTPYIPQTVQNH